MVTNKKMEGGGGGVASQKLPIDVFQVILKHTKDPRDARAVASTCTKFHKRFFNHPATWRTWSVAEALRVAALRNNKELIDVLLRDNTCIDMNDGLCGAAQGGHCDLINFFISKGAKAEAAMHNAGYGGKLDIIKLLRKQCPVLSQLRSGFTGAARAGHRNLVEYFIAEGVPLKWGLQGAAYGNRKTLVNFFIEMGCRQWNEGLIGACFGGHRHLVNFFIAKGANAWNHALWGAASSGSKDLVDMFIAKGANDWNRALLNAIGGADDVEDPSNHINLIRFFRGKGAVVTEKMRQLAKRKRSPCIVDALLN